MFTAGASKTISTTPLKINDWNLKITPSKTKIIWTKPPFCLIPCEISRVNMFKVEISFWMTFKIANPQKTNKKLDFQPPVP